MAEQGSNRGSVGEARFDLHAGVDQFAREMKAAEGVAASSSAKIGAATAAAGAGANRGFGVAIGAVQRFLASINKIGQYVPGVTGATLLMGGAAAALGLAFDKASDDIAASADEIDKSWLKIKASLAKGPDTEAAAKSLGLRNINDEMDSIADRIRSSGFTPSETSRRLDENERLRTIRLNQFRNEQEKKSRDDAARRAKEEKDKELAELKDRAAVARQMEADEPTRKALEAQAKFKERLQRELMENEVRLFEEALEREQEAYERAIQEREQMLRGLYDLQTQLDQQAASATNQTLERIAADVTRAVAIAEMRIGTRR